MTVRPLPDPDRPHARAPARTELGAFLRARREGCSPEQAGLPATRRRRTPGLRREELAVLAGVSVTWCTWLEQGRNVHASDQVLRALAGALGLTGPSARTCSHWPALSTTDRSTRRCRRGWRAWWPRWRRTRPTSPTPCSTCWPSTMPPWSCSPARTAAPGPRPTSRAGVFSQPAARKVLVDWEQVARDLLARLRAATGRHQGDVRAAALVAELRSGSAQADAWWQRYDVAAPHAGTKRLRHPRDGEVMMVHTGLAVADHPDQTLVVYTPPPRPQACAGDNQPPSSPGRSY